MLIASRGNVFRQFPPALLLLVLAGYALAYGFVAKHFFR
jgi:hypothetical protein